MPPIRQSANPGRSSGVGHPPAAPTSCPRSALSLTRCPVTDTWSRTPGDIPRARGGQRPDRRAHTLGRLDALALQPGPPHHPRLLGPPQPDHREGSALHQTHIRDGGQTDGSAGHGPSPRPHAIDASSTWVARTPVVPTARQLSQQNPATYRRYGPSSTRPSPAGASSHPRRTTIAPTIPGEESMT